MRTLEKRLDQAERIIYRADFRENKGLGNEVGYYVFDYPPESELLIRQRISYLKNKNSFDRDGFELVVFDLYDLIIGILEREGFLEKYFTFEKKRGLKYLIRTAEKLLKTGDQNDVLVQHIQANIPEQAVVFLTGIGKCYPILRSHTILNNLHQTMDRVPIVLFYPGAYDSQELMLFSTIKDGNYYRAFKLVD